MNAVDSGTTWPEAVLILGLVLAVLLLIGGAAATVLESR